MKKVIVYIKYICASFIYMILSLFIKRENNYIAFGSWCGECYIDNSRYLFEYLSKNYPHLKLYWVGKNHLRKRIKQENPNVTFITLNSFMDSLKLLKCKYFFFSQDHDFDICKMNVFNGAKLCYLHHGMPIKKWGDDGLNNVVQRNSIIESVTMSLKDYITGKSKKYDYFITSSELHDITNLSSLKSRGCVSNKNLHSGTPRNDMLVNYDSSYSLLCKKKYSKKYGFDLNMKVMIYLPTYRRTNTDVFSFSTLSSEEMTLLNNILEKNNICIIEKSHFAEKVTFNHTSIKNIKYVGNEVDVQEMLLFSDYLISDYSGAFLDYSILDRPIIHFAYDYEYYRDIDSGLYYDIVDFSAGRVVYDFKSLLNAIENIDSDGEKYRQKRNRVRLKYMSYERGIASEVIYKKIINNSNSEIISKKGNVRL